MIAFTFMSCVLTNQLAWSPGKQAIVSTSGISLLATAAGDLQVLSLSSVPAAYISAAESVGVSSTTFT